MRIHIATVGTEPFHLAQRQLFVDMAGRDEVGQHPLTADPAEADAIIFVDLHQHPHDPFLLHLRKHPLVAAFRDRIYVYDERDLPIYTFPGIYVSGRAALTHRFAMAGGPYPSTHADDLAGSAEPDLLFSFQGARTHHVRDAVLKLEGTRSIVEDTSDVDFFAWSATAAGEANRIEGRRRYVETLKRSKFVLCPRGHGLSSFRLFETLGAGRVPVVISDDWLAPASVAWQSCSLRVAEDQVQRLPELLAATEQRWDGLALAAQRTYEHHFKPGRIWHHYASALVGLNDRRATASRLTWAHSEVAKVAVRHVRQRISWRRCAGALPPRKTQATSLIGFTHP